MPASLHLAPAAEATHEAIILRALIENENGYVSGGELAKTLGVSRVAVWQQMEKLRAHGFEFKARRAHGYKITSYPSQLYAALVEAHLAPRKLKYRFTLHPTIDSTNEEAARQLSSGLTAPLIVAAHSQSQGRGRFGRQWHSADNGNLYISFAFRPQIDPARMHTFTLWMGINICELITNFTRQTPALKWPNDLYLDNRKAGGMLTEARIDSDQIRDLVFGLGLNLNASAHQLPSELTSRATTLAEHTRTPIDPNRFTAALIGRVFDAYQEFIKDSYRSTLADRWHPLDHLRGRTITLHQGEKQITGTAAGIDDEGSLLIRLPDGKLHRYRAGEVSLSPR